MPDPFEALERLEDNWYGEDEPKPSRVAIALGREIYATVAIAGPPFDDVDADVMGGVALYHHAPYIWVAIRNDGEIAVVADGEPSLGHAKIVKAHGSIGNYVVSLVRKAHAQSEGCAVESEPRASSADQQLLPEAEGG